MKLASSEPRGLPRGVLERAGTSRWTGGWWMLTFLAVALTFPTVLFGILLGVAMLYWLLAATGLVQLDLLDGLLGGDGGADAFSGEPGGLTGPLMRFGLGGVPLTLALTVLLLFAWLLSYFLTVLVLQGSVLGAFTMGWGTRLAILGGALVGALPLAALSLRPARRFFARLQPVPRASFIGMAGVVRSPELTDTQGTVDVQDGGAGLVLQARDAGGRFRRGDRVVLVEYVEHLNAYRVSPGHDPEHAP